MRRKNGNFKIESNSNAVHLGARNIQNLRSSKKPTAKKLLPVSCWASGEGRKLSIATSQVVAGGQSKF